VPVVSISLPDDLVEELDARIEEGGYKGRSEFLRAAVRHYLQDATRVGPGHMHGSITVTYPEGAEPRLSEIRHAFHDVVLSMMHTHCEPELCMDVLIVGGDGDRIQSLQDALERDRAVQRARLVPIA
jgi:CopG family transcriptional regulator, nickel-responsive regulator